MSLFADMASRLMSPYQLNPFNVSPLEGLLSAEVDFEVLRASVCIETRLSSLAASVAAWQARLS